MTIPIVLAINDGYVRQAIVTMRSAIRCAEPGTQYHFYILTYDITQENQQWMRDMIGDVALDIVLIDESAYSIIPEIGRFGKEACFRLYIPQLLLDINKAIYLDADTMVVGDLTELYSIDLSNKAYAACNEKRFFEMLWNPLVDKSNRARVEFYAEHGLHVMDENAVSINSGVMLINGEYWRQHRLTERTMEWIVANKDDKRFFYVDQEAISVITAQDGVDTVHSLDWKYNICDDILLQPYDKNNIIQQAFYRLTYYDLCGKRPFVPYIVHYAGTSKKPWKGYNRLLADKYREYAQEIGWVIMSKDEVGATLSNRNSV